MRVDFLDAHHRHWDDAEHLFQAHRWANADHLYGFAAECGLKRLMQRFGMVLDAQGSPLQGDDRVHVDQAWRRYETYRNGHVDGVAFALPSANPFRQWKAGQRYAAQSQFNQARATSHQSGALQVRALVLQARMNGLI